MQHYQLILYSICFAAFFLQTMANSRNNNNRLFNDKGNIVTDTGSLADLYAGGIFWFGLFPASLPFHSAGLNILPAETPTALQGAFFTILFLLIIIAGVISGRKIVPGTGKELPSRNFLGYYFVLRIAFIFCYELFYRGFLLFDSAEIIGIPLAVLCSTGLTVLQHVFNSKKEMWACIPFGVLLCCCCLLFGSVWPAVILHIALCISHEASFIHHYYINLKSIK